MLQAAVACAAPRQLRYLATEVPGFRVNGDTRFPPLLKVALDSILMDNWPPFSKQCTDTLDTLFELGACPYEHANPADVDNCVTAVLQSAPLYARAFTDPVRCCSDATVLDCQSALLPLCVVTLITDW